MMWFRDIILVLQWDPVCLSAAILVDCHDKISSTWIQYNVHLIQCFGMCFVIFEHLLRVFMIP